MKRFLFTLAVLACFGAYAVSFDISTGDLTITSAGSWDVTGTTTAHSIIINTADAVNITLDNVSITGVNCAFDIQSGTVYLSLTGANTLTSTAAAGLHVASDASLAITGDGSLTATSQGEEGAGIGGNKRENSGEVIITSGTITANGATYAAGIGGGGHGCANVMIEGGVVKATSGWLGAGIGGGTGWEGGAGSVTINGGFVKAEGNNGAGIGCGDEGGRIDPGTVVINGGTVEAHAGSGAGIGAGSGSGESGRGPEIIIAGGSVKASSDSGFPIGPGAGQGECPAPLNEQDGEVVYLATVGAAFNDSGTEYTFTTTKDDSPYTYAYTGAGHTANGDMNLYFYLPSGEYTASGTNGRNFAGTINDAPGTLTRYIPGEVAIDISEGDVTIETEVGAKQDGTIIGLYGNYIISGSSLGRSVTVDSSEAPTVTLSGASITDVNCAFDIQSGSVSLVLENNNTLTSTGAAGLHVANGASVTISGTGSLTATSQGEEGAGIGGNKRENSGAVVIESGTVTANGAGFAAGIGGGGHATGNVTINGGVVTANCGAYAAGIGGGTGWEGGTGSVTINGGFVKARGGNGAGIGCGDEGGHNAPGTVTITGGTIEAHGGSGAGIGAGNASGESGQGPQIYISGGSVKATSDSGSPIGQGAGQGTCPPVLNALAGENVYVAPLAGATAPAVNSIYNVGDGEVTFTATRTSDQTTYGYTGEGHSDTYDLYFYLPEGTYTIAGNNGKTYAGSVSSSGSTIMETPEPAIFGILALVALCLRRR